MSVKRLTRSKKDKIIFGLIGGVGQYLNVDANVLRLAWIIITALSGFLPGIVAYIFAAFIIPQSKE